MQLRIARLCLDCEELHIDNSCPHCASESYAFLSNWLPSEERRRWRRPRSNPSVARERGVEAVTNAIARWFRGERGLNEPTGPATRRRDHIADLNFDDPTEQAPRAPVVEAVEARRPLLKP